MSAQPGFLESLGVSPVDEKDAVTAQRDALLNKVEAARKAQGRTAGRGVAGLLGGVSSVLRTRSFKGVGAAVNTAFSEATDNDVASASGITVEQLRGRREMRKAGVDLGGSGSFEDRIKLARKIASIANISGDSDILGASLRKISEIRTEEQEFKKLKGQAESAESKGELEGVVSAWLDGEAVDGTVSTDENGRQGLMIADKSGNLKFVPWGDRLTRTDIAALSRTVKSDDEHISSTLGKKEFNSVRGQVLTNRDTIKRYDSLLTTLRAAGGAGNLQSVVGDAGKTISVLSNMVRTIKGVLGSFAEPGYVGQKDKFMEMALNPNASIWDNIAMPVWFEKASAQAQQYRSQIMELAYLSAAAAEPSGRGLSDSDIKNALIRLGAESGNPAVLFRRSMEIVAAGANTIFTTLDGYHGSFTRRDGSKIANNIVDSVLAGDGITLYRTELDALYKKHGVTITGDNRASFDDPIDIDVQPVDTTADLAPNVADFIGPSDEDVDDFFAEDKDTP